MISKRAFFIFVPILLLSGIVTALARLKWVQIPGSEYHGMLMVNGFFGGIITMEKAFHRNWAFVSYIILIFSLGLFLLGFEHEGVLGIILCTLVLTVDEVFKSKSKDQYYHVLQITGLLAWLAGSITFFRTDFYPAGIPFWQAFVFLVIASTRLKRIGGQFNLKVILFTSTYVVSLCFNFHTIGYVFIGIHLILFGGLLMWLELKYTLENRRSLITTYSWLIIAGMIMIFSEDMLFGYDLLIHTFFLGFAFNMIFINAGKLLSEKMGISSVKLKPLLWTTIMSAGLTLRIIAEFAADTSYRVVGGVINVLAILGFMLFVIICLLRNHRK